MKVTIESRETAGTLGSVSIIQDLSECQDADYFLIEVDLESATPAVAASIEMSSDELHELLERCRAAQRRSLVNHYEDDEDDDEDNF